MTTPAATPAVDEWHDAMHRVCTCDHRLMGHWSDRHATTPLACRHCPCKRFREAKR